MLADEVTLGCVVEGLEDFSTKQTGEGLGNSQPGYVPCCAGEERRKAYL